MIRALLAAFTIGGALGSTHSIAWSAILTALACWTLAIVQNDPQSRA
jgi:hypothetical protein